VSGSGLELTFLGTGTSFGIPVVGCRCPVCTSDDPRDRRGRHGVALTLPQGTLLVDTPPELRILLLQAGVERVDAVWFTHLHADHVHGIDDLRIFSLRTGRTLPAFVPGECEAELRARFRYIFDESHWIAPGTSIPDIDLTPFGDGPVSILGADITPLPVPHGGLTVYGLRVGGLGYVTDGKRLPDEVLASLEGVDTLVLNALWWGDPHPSHFNIEEAIEVARAVGARRTFITHLTHRVRHEELLRELPDGIEPAYDGLSVEVP
jgi:phosphoribosyl 1,2-cyclic phosphate phosphodiesterase